MESNDVTPVRFVDRATLTGTEVVPTGQGDLYVYEFDSRAPTGLELPTSTDTSVEPTIPMITNHTETSTPATILDPWTLLNQLKATRIPLETTFRNVHSSGLSLLTASATPTPKNVITPPSVDAVKSLDPTTRLPLSLTIPSLDSRVFAQLIIQIVQ